MSKIRGLFDRKDEDEMQADQENTESFSGGHRSGLAVEYPDQRDARKVIRVDTFSNGFTVDGGPFRPFSLPDNVEFMETMRAGAIPDELARAMNGRGEVEIELHQFEREYDPSQPTAGGARPDVKPETKPGFVPFGGTASTLGSGAVQATSVPVSADVPTPVVSSGATTTSIQLRLPNGQRVTRCFDESAVGAVLAELVAPALGVDPSSLVISAGFPPKPIEFSNLQRCTIKDLGLCGSTVNITLKK